MRSQDPALPWGVTPRDIEEAYGLDRDQTCDECGDIADDLHADLYNEMRRGRYCGACLADSGMLMLMHPDYDSANETDQHMRAFYEPHFSNLQRIHLIHADEALTP